MRVSLHKSAFPQRWWGRDSYPQDAVDHYDEELDRGGQGLIEDLRALTRANMEAPSRGRCHSGVPLDHAVGDHPEQLALLG
jgi:hypothetical protein